MGRNDKVEWIPAGVYPRAGGGGNDKKDGDNSGEWNDKKR